MKPKKHQHPLRFNRKRIHPKEPAERIMTSEECEAWKAQRPALAPPAQPRLEPPTPLGAPVMRGKERFFG